jgi:Fic family protein
MGVKIASFIITPEILGLISEIDEFKGAWRALGELAPEQLSALKKVATIESIGSSTRIEGSKLTDKEVEALLSNLEIQKFDTRDEQEVAGYSAAMNLIFQHYEDITLSENTIRQLHTVLLQYSEKDNWHRGNYKNSPNQIVAFDAKGEPLGVVFETASPFETPIRMRELVEWTQQAYADKSLHPLLITAIVVVEFLAIHPFQDGNGRLSRILTTYLLLKAGYHYVPFSSLESIIEHSKETYYLSLRKTQATLKDDHPDWQPWGLFFLKALRDQKRRLEYNVTQENRLLTQLPPLSLQIIQFIKSRGKATISDIAIVTGANRNTVKKHLQRLVEINRLQKNGVGKGTWYSL